MKNKNSEATAVAEIKPKQVTEVIEEIHETFFTEVDRLLASANISNSLQSDKQSLVDKSARLKALGFTNTKEVKEAEAEINRLNKLQKENEEKKELIEAINFFSAAYPAYKFITENSVKKICQKYGLIYGPVSRYKGTVPDKNLKHIEEFKINDEHVCYMCERNYIGLGAYGLVTTYMTKEECATGLEEYRKSTDRNRYMLSTNFEVCPLEIVAPVKDFDTIGMEVKDSKLQKIEIPDPIVLQPVIFNKKKHYLIVTAWGEEASDELVVNHNMN